MANGEGLCEIHPEAPWISAGPDAVCSRCVEEFYQHEKKGEAGVFAKVVGSISEPALRELNARLEERVSHCGIYPYESLLRAVIARALSTGCTVDEVLAKIADIGSADFLFLNFN